MKETENTWEMRSHEYGTANFERMPEEFLELLEKGVNFQGSEKRLWETMRSIGKDILEVVLEAKDQEIYREKTRIESFKVICREDLRTILTLFGDLDFPQKSGGTIRLP